MAEPPSAPCASTLQRSVFSGNIVEDNGGDGILIGASSCESPPPPQNQFNEYISLVDNIAQGNQGNDCEDDTANGAYPPPVSLTLGTADNWYHNIGTSSSPTGLCTPGRWHDDDLR